VRSWRRDELRERVEEMIRGRQLWGKRLPADRQLAEELGANRRTLQKALADLEADGVIERRHGSGTFVRRRGGGGRGGRRGARKLAVIVAGHHRMGEGWSYGGEMVRGALGQSRRLKCEASVFSLGEDAERERVRDPRVMREFGGFILVGMKDRLLVRQLLDLRRGPVVLVDRSLSDMPVTSVLDGTFEGMRALAGHLVGLGHRRIAFFHEKGLALVNIEKFDGYRAALARGGLEVSDELLACPVEPQPKEEYAEKAVDELLGLEDPPTAIVATRDHRAVTLMSVLERRGLRVGKDISVAGFGDTAIREGTCDTLTSCRIYPRKFGQEAVRAALEPGRRSEGRIIIIPDRLMIRSSTCEPIHKEERGSTT
jgi:DNA-binding LacI/PurR family transcriptional regulator